MSTDDDELDVGEFPTLQDSKERLDPDTYRVICMDYARLASMQRELESDRKSLRLKLEKTLLERDSMRTAFLGLLNLASEEEPLPFLQQILEIIARLIPSGVGALAVWNPKRENGLPLLVTRHCSSRDQAFIEAEVHSPHGLLNRARESTSAIHLLEDSVSARVMGDLAVRHVHAAVAIPYGSENSSGLRMVLYLEHFSRAEAFSQDLTLVNECLAYAAQVLGRFARSSEISRRYDHTAAYRVENRYDNLAGRSEFMGRLLSQLELLRISQTNASVLITGEVGVGKRTIAMTIHANSSRSSAPFKSISCSAYKEDELEITLFGDEREIYLQSRRGTSGLLEAAAGGTLYLENITSLSPSLQQKLLEVLRKRQFLRVGSEIVQEANVRLICSSPTDLNEVVRDGRFLDTLAEKISLLELHVPPLQARREDILPLADFFLAELGKKKKRRLPPLSAGAIEELERGSWKKNLDGLRSTLEKAVAHCKSDEIEIGDLYPTSESKTQSWLQGAKPWKAAHDKLRRELITEALAKSKGKVAAAAALLGISRQQLNKRIRELDLRSPKNQKAQGNEKAGHESQ